MTKIKTNRNNTNNVPHLRFPEFSGEWEKNNLSKFSSKITKKNKGNVIQNVLCNSANLGIIPQNDYFDRDIANADNTDSYYIIEHGDFVYNPRKSTAAPYGPVNIYNGEKPGIISPLYLCFSVLNISPSFLFYRFKSSVWHPYVYSHGDTGVRFDRVSIKDDVFFDMPIYTPTQNEQEKIATLLSLIDERIATQNKIIEKLETLIKALSHKLTTQQRPNTRLKDCLTYHSSALLESDVKGIGQYPVYGATGICGYMDKYEISGDSILIIKDGASVGSTAYATGKYSTIGTLNYLRATQECYLLPYIYYSLKAFDFRPYITGMAIPHIYFKDYSKAKIWCPAVAEQKRIATTLRTMDTKLQIEHKILRNLILQKQYLLSNLFI